MILIVDDNQENLFSLKALLDIHKFQVDMASSGEEALRKILKNQYALIILDVQMPEMDGFEVAEAVSGYSKSKDIPIIFLSAVNVHKRFITKGYTSGGIDYVTKPFDPDILLLKIKTFYRLSEQTRQLNEMDKFLRAEIEFRKQAESKLQANVAELQSVLESIPQLAFTLQADGNIEFVNKVWYQYGYDNASFPESEGLPIPFLIQEALGRPQKLIREVKIKMLVSQEFRFHVLYLTPVFKDAVLIKWVGIFTDIHEQKMSAHVLERKVQERTAELEKLNERLEVSNHELRQFAFVASHDLQEPLRKIQTFSNLILDRFMSDQSKAVFYLRKISSSAARLRTLVSDLLHYANIKDDKFVLTDINEIIEGILQDFELQLTEKNATVHIDRIPPMEVMPVQMGQVFQNLLSNALKFCKNGIPCKIQIHAMCVNEKSFDATEAPGGKYCKVIFKDNGIGFDEKFLDRIFEIFQRLNTRDLYEGNGIGLAIVKRVIERHNGSITATSSPSEGSSFIMVIPKRQGT